MFLILTPRWDAHREIKKKYSNVSAKSKPSSKIFDPVLSGTKMDLNHEQNSSRKSRDTLWLMSAPVRAL